MSGLVCQGYQALTSGDMKALRSSANEAQRASLQRKHLCTHQKGRQTTGSLSPPPTATCLPALHTRAVCVYPKTPTEGCSPSSLDQACPQSSYSPENSNVLIPSICLCGDLRLGRGQDISHQGYANTTLNQEKISSFLRADIHEGSFALCCIVRTTTRQDEAQAALGAACHLAPFPLMDLLSCRP